jgi:AraC family transcriptional activator FtrA
MVSICTGAFTLAGAGLLDGRTATTHWRHAALLARRHPRVAVAPDVLYVDGGDVLTSAGTAAGIDLCLHIVRRDHGAEAASALARRMVLAAHRDGGQAQFVERAVAPEVRDPAVAEAMRFARDHLAERLTVERLAARAHLSPRQLSRRFRAATGSSPGDWLLRERLDAGRAMLETGDEPIDEIARRAGLPNTSGFRRHFRAAFGVSPARYRQGYRGSRAA